MTDGTPRYPNVLDADAIEFAREQLNETDDKRENYVQRLKKHFEANEPNIKVTTDDDLLIAFLRGSKYSLERATTKLRNYYTMRTETPNIFSERDPQQERMQKLLELGCFVPLRKLSHGKLVVIIRPAAYDPKVYTFEEALKVGYVILDVCSKLCPHMQVYGVTAIFDMKNISLGHARQMSPRIIKHLVSSWENYHCRPKHLEFINAPIYVNVVINVFKSFMSQKLKNRVRVHYNDFSNLYSLVDKDVLPNEYDGFDGTMQDNINFWTKEVTQHRDWLIYDEQFKLIKN